MRCILLFCLGAIIFSCQPTEQSLPVLGQHEYATRIIDGKEVPDTIFYSISDFSFYDQDSALITERTVEDKIYVTDFFFTSCPSICPRMKKNMRVLYEEFASETDLMFLSHSIDTRHDSVPVLKAYADRMEIESERWHLVTGTKENIYGMAKQYMIAASEDPKAPGGYVHSGAFILMDKQRRIRGYYDGTKEADTRLLKKDIKRLLSE